MFLHKVENDYFDVLTKKYIHPEQLTEKSRYSLSGDSVCFNLYVCRCLL